MGEEIFEEGIKCSECLKEAEVYCVRCRRWHCLVCEYLEATGLDKYPEHFT